MSIETQALLTGILSFAVIGLFIYLIYIIFRGIYRTIKKAICKLSQTHKLEVKNITESNGHLALSNQTDDVTLNRRSDSNGKVVTQETKTQKSNPVKPLSIDENSKTFEQCIIKLYRKRGEFKFHNDLCLMKNDVGAVVYVYCYWCYEFVDKSIKLPHLPNRIIEQTNAFNFPVDVIIFIGVSGLPSRPKHIYKLQRSDFEYLPSERLFENYLSSYEVYMLDDSIQLQHADDDRSREYEELQAYKEAVQRKQSEIAERQAREEAERCAREVAELQNREAAERMAKETAERCAIEEAELQAYREAVQRKRENIERQEKAEIVTRKAIDMTERVVQDKSSSHYQSSRQWPKVNNEDSARTNAPSSNRMVHSLVTAPKVSKSSSHYETSKDWPAVEQSESERKGFAFEQFVDEHFRHQYFKRISWRSDIKGNDGRLSEDSKYPDLEYEHRKSKTRFAVECKWRNSFYKNGVQWANNKKQMDNYRNYGKEKGISVIVMIGIGGSPDSPEKLYSIPLSVIQSDFLTKEDLWDYFVGKPPESFYYIPEEHNIRLYQNRSKS